MRGAGSQLAFEFGGNAGAGRSRRAPGPGLDQRGGELLKREQELAYLMQRARQSAGGELAVAIAYQNEYNTVKGDLREIELTGADRNCVLKYRTASDRAVR